MNIRNLNKFLIMFLCLLSMPVGSLPSKAIGNLKIIGSDSLDIQYNDSAYLYGIFMFRIRYDGYGSPITVVHMPVDSPEFEDLVTTKLYLSTRNYKHKLRKGKVLGKRLKVLMSKDKTDMIRIISEVPHSIGYISGTLYTHDDKEVNNVKTIVVSDAPFNK